jgi:hypothetical protein
MIKYRKIDIETELWTHSPLCLNSCIVVAVDGGPYCDEMDHTKKIDAN